jgi:hypothetical protein
VNEFARRHALRAALVALLALLATRSVLNATGGSPAVPLDDAFIHFQYARSLWEGRFLAFSPGAEPAAGATSLLWPLVLTIAYGLGLHAEHLIWAAWALGWVSLGLLGYETGRAADRLLSKDGALGAELMVLTFGGNVWFAASGMEVVPLAWLLMRAARRSAEWLEAPEPARSEAGELLLLAFAGPALRPEGALATLMVAAAFALHPARKDRTRGLFALSGALVPGLVNRLATGSATTTTALVKWLPLSPYYAAPGKLLHAVLANVTLLFGTLLNGEIWSAVFLPQGSAFVLWPALPAVVWLGFRRGVPIRAALVAVVGLGMLVPTTYDSFLWNRLRYLWPFMPAWLLGVAALTDVLGMALVRYAPGFERARLLGSGVVVGGFLSHLGWTLDDLATSANAIRAQQAELGHWAADALPKDAVIGVNDTGAIGYFSERRLFDVVGLTTPGEARYWTAGAGSRFEHYERLGRRALPTHFIVYPQWFALPSLLGEYRTDRRVTGATILGGETMVAYQADYSALGSGARPRTLARGEGLLADELDVADLESEALHGYVLYAATSEEDVAVAEDGVVDGARRGRSRDTFTLRLVPGGELVLRVAADEPAVLTLRGAGGPVGSATIEPGPPRELVVPVPGAATGGAVRLDVESSGPRFTALHYWSYRPSPR